MLRLLAVLPGLLLPLAGHAQSTVILRSNYDAVITVDDSFSQVRSRVELRDGSTFPIEFQNHKLHIQITTIKDETYEVDLKIFENSQGAWFPINSDRIAFKGSYGIPLEYKWSGVGVQVDLALVVSRFRGTQDADKQ